MSPSCWKQFNQFSSVRSQQGWRLNESLVAGQYSCFKTSKLKSIYGSVKKELKYFMLCPGSVSISSYAVSDVHLDCSVGLFYQFCIELLGDDCRGTVYGWYLSNCIQLPVDLPFNSIYLTSRTQSLKFQERKMALHVSICACRKESLYI